MNAVIYTELSLIQEFLFLEHYPEISRDITGDTNNKFRSNMTGEKDFIYYIYL